MDKIKKLLIATGMLYSLNSAGNFATAQIKDEHAKIAEKSRIIADSLKKEKPNYAKELLDLEKQAGFDVQPFHYKFLDSLVNEMGKYISVGGVAEDYKKTQALDNLGSINSILKRENFIYKENADLFCEALKTKDFNSFHFLVLYLESASKNNFQIVPIRLGEHFFVRWHLNDSDYLNWEIISGIEQKSEFYEKAIKQTFKEIKKVNWEVFLAQEYKAVGIALNKDKKYNEAIEYFDKSILENVGDPETYKYQGDSWFLAEDYEKAISDYDTAIKLNEKFTQAYIGRGDVYYKIGKLEKALKDYDKAISLDSRNLEVYEKRGDVLSKKKDSKKAQEDYNKSLELILKK